MAPVSLDCATIRVIAAAIAEGQLVVVTEGARALPERAAGKPPAPIRAEACGRGRAVARALHLDEIDRETA